MTESTTGISQAAFARREGVPVATVVRWIRDGRITANADGSIDAVTAHRDLTASTSHPASVTPASEEDAGSETESQSAFATRCNFNRSTITRMKQAGRLVLTDSGDVVIQASLDRIAATRGTRYDVEDRNAARRTDAAPNLATLDLDEIGRRTRHAQMLEREAVARMREREDQELAGQLVRRDAVTAAMTTAVGIILNASESLPDRLTPLLLDVSDQNQIRALLRDEIEQLLALVTTQLKKTVEKSDV